MKAKLVPLYFVTSEDADFKKQVAALKSLLADECELLEPLALGSALPDADAVVFPQMLGNAYRRLAEFKAIQLPILIITSEFGTVSMWDWEIRSYLRSEGVETIAPYNLEQTKVICRALALKREMKASKFLVYQDNPGEGFQAEIFKRFYWWEDECTQRMKDQFGIQIVKKSFKELGAAAKAIEDREAEAAWQARGSRVATAGLSPRAINSAVKIYLAVKRDLDQDSSVKAAGINCLNESHFSDTTPCLAWNLLFEEEKLIWGCEADSVSMLSEYLVYRTLEAPFMMTNLYPFLMGMAALKHERIPGFPQVASEPGNHVLAAHCGFLGVLPQSFSTDWTLRKKVLAIVDDNAHAMDARLPLSPITLVKLQPTFTQLSVFEGELTGYAQFPGSDCLNGAVIRVEDGPKLMDTLSSHHYILVQGRHREHLGNIGKVFGITV
jgi:hypothetical protein